MTLALDKLPTPPVFVPGDGTVYKGVEYADDSQAWSAYYRDAHEPMKQRLAMAVGLVNKLRPYAIGPHYADEYGNEIPPDLDTSPALLAEVDAFLALLGGK